MENFESNEVLPEWFIRMQLTDTYMEDNDSFSGMDIDQNFRSEIPNRIENYTINEKPRPKIELIMRSPPKTKRLPEYREIEIITGNAINDPNPPKQHSTPNKDQKESPKRIPSKLTARRLSF